MKLNQAQKEAVEHIHGPLLILAGAGSGKTSVLMSRIEYMIKNGIEPRNILAVTFTNKAATEMKERIAKKVGEEKANNLTMQTFHSFCLDILRREVKMVDELANGFQIADDAWSKRIVKGILKGVKTRVQPGTIAGYISSLKGELVTPQMLGEENFSSELVDATKVYGLIKAFKEAGHFDVLQKVYPIYENKLRQANAVDFDDFMMLVIHLFIKHPEVLEKYQNRFRYIMIDEYQDTNRAQYMVSKLLAAKYENIAVVGDENQSIYAFRGADIRNILDFDRDFKDAKIVKLEENYRSTQRILTAANQVIEKNKGRKDKKLYTNLGEGKRIKIIERDYLEDQGAFIAEKISELVKKGVRNYNDFTVLYRTNRQSLTIETALKGEGIPHTIYSGLGFFEREEIQDIIKYLQFMLNSQNVEAFERVIQKPKRRIGEKTIDKIFNELGDKTILDILKEPEGIIRMQKVGKQEGIELAEIIEKYQAVQDTTSVLDVIKGILSDVKYEEKYLSTYSESIRKDKLENIDELYNWIAREQDKKGSIVTADEFIEKVTLGSSTKDQNDEDGVKLMSIHASKGLEFPVVFMIGMNNQTFPTYQAIDLCQFGDDSLLEEERRLCYVAITRAKEELYMTYIKTRVNQKGERSEVYPSTFIYEFDSNLKDYE
jgi:DNA helicase-2/ATP-dependent DNA helicase PcrA